MTDVSAVSGSAAAPDWEPTLHRVQPDEHIEESDSGFKTNARAKGGQDEVSRCSGRSRLRKRLLLGFGILLAGIAGLGWGWATFFASATVATDDAYTNVEIADITPLTSGPVKKIDVVNTQAVKAGEILFTLDDTDQRLAVNQARADLNATRRKVRELMAKDANLAGEEDMREAAVAVAHASLEQAKAHLEKANLDTKRRRTLIKSGSVSVEALDNAETTLHAATAAVALAEAQIKQAEAALAAAQGARNANRALFDGASVENNPEVLAALAKLNQAQLNLDRTVIRSPISGVVDQRKLAVGQRVQAGSAVMVVVPINSMYVDANFKENQLGEVRPGQPVALTSDIYGSDVVFHGHVAGFAGGSGSAFASIPAQNATGNWIKVVQRLPVRIALDPQELKLHPLRVGLSMMATIDLSANKQ